MPMEAVTFALHDGSLWDVTEAACEEDTETIIAAKVIGGEHKSAAIVRNDDPEASKTGVASGDEGVHDHNPEEES